MILGLAWPLGLGVLALTGVLAWEVKGMTLDDPGPVARPTPAPPVVAEAAPREDPTPLWMATTLARPLFRQDRRPHTDLPLATASAPALPRLTGIVVSPAGGFAIFANTDGGKPSVVREGDEVGAAVIEAVAAGQVTLRGPDGLVVLHPIFDEKALPASRPSPAIRRGGHDAAVLNR